MLVTACERRGSCVPGRGFVKVLGGWEARRGVWDAKWRAGQEPPNSLLRNERARKLSPNSRALPYLPANYLSEASKVCCEAGAF